MSSNNASEKVVTVDEQAFENAGRQAVDEDGFPVVDGTPEFEATVEQETQAKMDANYPDGIAEESGQPRPRYAGRDSRRPYRKSNQKRYFRARSGAAPIFRRHPGFR